MEKEKELKVVDESGKTEQKVITKPSEIEAGARLDVTLEVKKAIDQVNVTGVTEKYISHVAPSNSKITVRTIEVLGDQDVTLPIMKKMPNSWEPFVHRFTNGVPPQPTLRFKYRMSGNIARPKEWKEKLDKLVMDVTSKFMGIFQGVETREESYLRTRVVTSEMYEKDVMMEFKDILSKAEFSQSDYDDVVGFWEAARKHTADIDDGVPFGLFMKMFFFFSFKDDIEIQQRMQEEYLQHYTLEDGVNRVREVVRKLFENKFRFMEPLPYDLPVESMRFLWNKTGDNLTGMLENKRNGAFRSIFIDYVKKIAQMNNLLPFVDLTSTLQELVVRMSSRLTEISQKNVVIQQLSGQKGQMMAELLSLWQGCSKYVQFEFPHTIDQAHEAVAIASALIWKLLMPKTMLTPSAARRIDTIIALFLYEFKREFVNTQRRSKMDVLNAFKDTERNLLQETMAMFTPDGKEDGNYVADAFSVFDVRSGGEGFYSQDADVQIVTEREDEEVFGSRAGYSPLWGNPAFGEQVDNLDERISRFMRLFRGHSKPLKDNNVNKSLWETLDAFFSMLEHKQAELSKIAWAMNEMARVNCLVMSFPASFAEQKTGKLQRIEVPPVMGLWSMIMFSDVSKLDPKINLPIQSVIMQRFAIQWTLAVIKHNYTKYFNYAEYPQEWFTKSERWRKVFDSLKPSPSTFNAKPATSLAEMFRTQIIDSPHIETFEMEKGLYPFETKIESIALDWIYSHLKDMGVVQRFYFCPKPIKVQNSRLKRGFFVADEKMPVSYTYNYDTLTRDIISNRGAFQKRLLEAMRNDSLILFEMPVCVETREYASKWSVDEVFKVEGDPAILNVGPLIFPLKRPGDRDDIYDTSLSPTMTPRYVLSHSDLDAVEPDKTVAEALRMIGGEVVAFKPSARFIGPSDVPSITKFISTTV